ncbi:MAG: DUF4097 domain-containing protein [Bdellovibrionales bacterium]|nr:DUF4097 domain-containing protein [Bdellovibrionales bacterium]
MKPLLLLVLPWVFFSAYAVESTSNESVREFDSKGLLEVSVANTSGKITVTATESAKAQVTTSNNKYPDKCSISIDRHGEQLSIKVDKKTSSFFSVQDCEVDIAVKVPKAVDLDLAIGSGKLIIHGIEGELDFKIGSGSIVADGLFREIDGKSGSGRIDIKGLAGGGELKTGSGGIDLTFAKKPLVGALDLKTGSGSANLMFPKGTKLKTNFQAGSGQVTNSLGETPEASFAVSMKAGSGDLKIKTY